MKYIAIASALVAAVSAKKCQQLHVPVTATGRNGVFDITSPANDIEVTNFILNLAQQGVNYTEKVLTGYATVSQKYSIAAEYCVPDSGSSDVLQILTHGIGFDRTYWDLPFNNYNYSYVNQAVDKYGYATFAYDRPGIGESKGGDPLKTIQSLVEVDALKELTLGLRSGAFKAEGISAAYDKVVHVGHSYGSEHTYALTAMYPTISDGIALTGFSQNGSFVPDFEYGGNFISANTVPSGAGLPNGYFAAAGPTGVQINFLAPGDFDPAILAYGFANGKPVTVGELLTIGGETGSPNKFAGPVHIVTGARDIPYCGGNCLAAPTGYANIPSTSKKNFADAKVFEVTIIPGAGHGLNYEYTWPQTYSSILEFFVQNGLAGSGASNATTDTNSTSTKTGGSWRTITA